jgi:hypothetical protein
MTSAAEPTLHAISVEPRSARYGETLRIVFRTRNYGTCPSPPGTVTFALAPELEALDATEVAVEAVEPGHDVVASIRAKVAQALPDRTQLPVSASFDTAGKRYATNVDVLVVHSDAVLDGEASGTFVEAIGGDAIRVRAIVTNEGDGPAQDLRIALRAPLGCERADGRAAECYHVARLDPGERCESSFEARIVAPVADLRADDATVSHGRGSVVLAARQGVRLEPMLAPPRAVVHASRRSARITVDVENHGWSDAAGVLVAIALPAAVRAVDDSVTLDGIPIPSRRSRRANGDALARVVREPNGVAVVVATIRARDSARIELSAAFPLGCADGSVGIAVGTHRIEVPFVPERIHDVRAYPLAGARSVAPGERAHLAARVVNAGDGDEVVSFRVAGPAAAAHDIPSMTLRAGTAAGVEFAVEVPHDALDGALLTPVFLVMDDITERSRAEFSVRVCDVESRFGRTASGPGSDLTGSDLTGALGEGAPPVSGTIRGPELGLAGVPFVVSLELHVRAETPALIVRSAPVPGAAYLPGSTVLDGHAVLDPIAGAPLGARSPLDGEGLMLREVPGDTRISAAWSIVPDPSLHGESLLIEAVLECDGARTTLCADPVPVCAREAFAARPAGLPYHIGACALATHSGAEIAVDPQPSIALPEELGWIEYVLRLDRARLDDLARLLGALRGDGLVAHLFVVRLFFPDAVSNGDSSLGLAFESVGAALRDVFDRLYVKLRIPGFAVSSDDLDDADLRRALAAWFTCLGDDALTSGEREALCAAPYGAPVALRALIRLLPTRCDDAAFSTALSRYAMLLDAVLGRYDGVPLELFDDALARGSDRALDDARRDLLQALEPFMAREPVC